MENVIFLAAISAIVRIQLEYLQLFYKYVFVPRYYHTY